MNDLAAFVKQHRHLMLFGKTTVLVSLLSMMLLATISTSSLTYQLLRSASSIDELLLVVFTGVAVFLFADILKFDMHFGRRSWNLERYIPVIYMLLGAGYLIIAFVSSATAGVNAIPLISLYLANAALSGWMAFITKLRIE